MKLNQIRDNPGARQAPRRVGRGIGSGLGKTSGRGGKGQTARSGVSLNGFEGGQTPIHRRVPKRGFRNTAFQKDFRELSLDTLQRAIDAKRVDPAAPINVATLVKAGVIRSARDGLRLLGPGEITSKITIEVAGASAPALAAIEKVGGTVVVLARVRPSVVEDSAAKKTRRAKRLAKKAPKGGTPKAAASVAEKAGAGEAGPAAKAAKPVKPSAPPAGKQAG